MRKTTQIIPREMWLPLLIAPVWNAIVYFGSRILTADAVHHNLSSWLDDLIPFIPWTVSIYLGCYLFWIVNYVLGCRQDREQAFRFISADLFAKTLCLVCFLALPTTNTRPDITGSSIWDELMRILYRADAADNLFPSIHCLTSWFCFIAVRENKTVPKWYRVVSLFIAAGICLSTLTTKQHVLIDMAAGIALAEESYLLADKIGFAKWYRIALRRRTI